MYPKKFSDLFPDRHIPFDKDPHAAPRTAVIITNFDHLMDMNGTESMVSALADMSYRTKKFNVMLCVQSWKNAEAILTWNNRYKIRLVDCAERGMWHKEHVQKLIAELHPSFESWGSPDLLALETLGVEAGTPGFITIAAASGNKASDSDWLKEKAGCLAQQWRLGSRALGYLHVEVQCTVPVF